MDKVASQAAKSTDKVSRSFGDMARNVGERLGSIGTKLSIGVTAPLALLGKQALDMAGEVSRSATVVQGTLGVTLDQLYRQTEGVRRQWVLSKADVAGLSGEVGLLTDRLGLTDEAQQGLNLRLLDAAGVWQALKGIDPAAFVDMVSAATRGEYDSLQQLIPSISAAKIEEDALALARAAGRGEASELDKTTAALNLILDETATKSGLAKEAMDGQAGAAARLKQQQEDLSLTIGQKLLPAQTKAYEQAGNLLDVFNQLSPATQNLAIGIGGVAFALGPVLFGVNQAIQLFTRLGPVLAGITPVQATLAAGILLTVDNLRLLATNWDQVSAAFSLKWKELERLIWAVAVEVHRAAEFMLSWVPGVGPELAGMRAEAEANLRRVTAELHLASGATHGLNQAIAQLTPYKEVHIDVNTMDANNHFWSWWNSIPKQMRINIVGDTGNIFRAQGGPVVPMQHGGPVRRRRWPYLVGEHGPEWFQPHIPGFIVNMRQAAAAVARLRDAPLHARHTMDAAQLAGAAINVASGAVQVVMTVDARGSVDPRGTADALEGRMRRVVDEGFDQFKRELRRRS